MVEYQTKIKKFDKQGEKTGWTYLEIPFEIAHQLNPNFKKSYRVKGKIDTTALTPISILPMGNGGFIMPLNASIRKQIKKIIGETIALALELETKEYELNSDFMLCLQDEPKALKHFSTLNRSHQNYFSKWIESAKTEATKTTRIARTINALSKCWSYPEMIRDRAYQ